LPSTLAITLLKENTPSFFIHSTHRHEVFLTGSSKSESLRRDVYIAAHSRNKNALPVYAQSCHSEIKHRKRRSISLAREWKKTRTKLLEWLSSNDKRLKVEQCSNCYAVKSRKRQKPIMNSCLKVRLCSYSVYSEAV